MPLDITQFDWAVAGKAVFCPSFFGLVLHHGREMASERKHGRQSKFGHLRGGNSAQRSDAHFGAQQTVLYHVIDTREVELHPSEIGHLLWLRHRPSCVEDFGFAQEIRGNSLSLTGGVQADFEFRRDRPQSLHDLRRKIDSH